MIGAYRGQWVRPPLESSLPHEIVDDQGLVRDGVGGYRAFKNRASATRRLHQLIERYDQRRRGPDNPRNWTVRPVKEGA